ncbi:MAG: DUF6787 family protein [Flavobacteriales bacterium]
MFKKLKKRWNIKSNKDVIIILIVFSITGYTSLIIAKPILEFIGIHQHKTNPWIYRPLRILLIFPFYQILIVFFGWLFGQFKFFWEFEKKMLRRMGLGFLFKK